MTTILIGNKVDLENERQVSYEEGQAFAKKHDLVFFETSAKSSHNVEKAFLAITQKIYTNLENGEYNIGNNINHHIKFKGNLAKNICLKSILILVRY